MPFHGLVSSGEGAPLRLVTQLATGGDLKKYVGRAKSVRGGISLLQLVDIVTDVCEGLYYLHSLQPEPVVLRYDTVM